MPITANQIALSIIGLMIAMVAVPYVGQIDLNFALHPTTMDGIAAAIN